MKRFGYKRGIIFVSFFDPFAHMQEKKIFKLTNITYIVQGLSLFVIGAICFYPAAISLKYGAFVGCLFVIACGLGTLENG
jgi:fucose permease